MNWIKKTSPLQLNQSCSSIQFRSLSQRQEGMALIVVLVVLLVLTLLGVASTDSGNLQSIMTRNNQLRIEAFNASNTEIEARIDDYRAAATGTIPADISTVLDSGKGVTNTLSSPVSKNEASKNEAFNKEVGLTHTGGCAYYLNSLGSGNKCYLLTLESDAEHKEITISSDQVQTLSYIAK